MLSAEKNKNLNDALIIVEIIYLLLCAAILWFVSI